MPGQESKRWTQSKKLLEVLYVPPLSRKNFPRGYTFTCLSALAGSQATVFFTVHRREHKRTRPGRWWGNDSVTRSQAEIDIMGEQDKTTALFGECKWTKEKVDLGVLETLIQRSKLFPYQKLQLYLFSKSGFTKGCVDQAKKLGNVTLVTYADILAAMESE